MLTIGKSYKCGFDSLTLCLHNVSPLVVCRRACLAGFDSLHKRTWEAKDGSIPSTHIVF